MVCKPLSATRRLAVEAAADILAPREGAADSHPGAEAAGNRLAAAEVGNHRQEAEVVGIRLEAEVVDQSADLQKLSELNRQGDVVEDLVNQRLSLGIPQREKDRDEPEDAQAEPSSHPIDELAQKGHPETDWLPGLFVDDLELHDRLADARTRCALPITEIPDPVNERKDRGDPDCDLTKRRCARRAEVTEVVLGRVCDTGGLAGADQQTPPDPLQDRERDEVDQPRRNTGGPRCVDLCGQRGTGGGRGRRVARRDPRRHCVATTRRALRWRWITTTRRRRRVTPITTSLGRRRWRIPTRWRRWGRIVTRGTWRLIGHGRLPVNNLAGNERAYPNLSIPR